MGAAYYRSGQANSYTFGNPRMRCGKRARLNSENSRDLGKFADRITPRIRNAVLEELQCRDLTDEEIEAFTERLIEESLDG
jgi:hypothetical protein